MSPTWSIIFHSSFNQMHKCQSPNLNSPKDTPVHKKHQLCSAVFIAMTWNLHYEQNHLQLLGSRDKWKHYSLLTEESLQTDRKKSPEGTGNKCYTKSVFAPADVESGLYTNLSVLHASENCVITGRQREGAQGFHQNIQNHLRETLWCLFLTADETAQLSAEGVPAAGITSSGKMSPLTAYMNAS